MPQDINFEKCLDKYVLVDLSIGWGVIFEWKSLDKLYQEICLFDRDFSRLYCCQDTKAFQFRSRN